MANKTRASWIYRWGFVLIALMGISGTVVAKYVLDRLNEPPEFRTVNIERRDLRITIATTGTVEPMEIVQVGPDIAGKIVAFGQDPVDHAKTVNVNSRVTRGTVLAQLDAEFIEIEMQKAQAARKLAEAEVAAMEIKLGQAKRTLDRAERLRNTNSQSEYDQAFTSHELALSELAIGQAKVEQAVAAESQVKAKLARTSIRAPIDGVIVDRRANLGQSTSAGSGIFLMAHSLDRLRVRASVSESDIGKIEIGQKATFSVDAYRDTKLAGRVDEILVNARMQGNFVTYDVLVAIDDPPIELLPNMTADVEFEIVKRENTWLVPNAALKWNPEKDLDANALAKLKSSPAMPDTTLVWLPSKDGSITPLPVQTGIDDGVDTELIGQEFREGMPVVVGVVKKTTLARIVPTARTTR